MIGESPMSVVAGRPERDAGPEMLIRDIAFGGVGRPSSPEAVRTIREVAELLGATVREITNAEVRIAGKVRRALAELWADPELCGLAAGVLGFGVEEFKQQLLVDRIESELLAAIATDDTDTTNE